MNRNQLATYVAIETEISQPAAQRMVTAVLDGIPKGASTPQGCVISSFGAFRIRDHAEREAYNPQTGDKIMAPAYRQLRFNAAEAMRDKLADGRLSSAKRPKGSLS